MGLSGPTRTLPILSDSDTFDRLSLMYQLLRDLSDLRTDKTARRTAAEARARARVKLQLLARAPLGATRHGRLAAALAPRSRLSSYGVAMLIPSSAQAAKLQRMKAMGLTRNGQRGFDEMLLILAHSSDLW